MLTLWYTCIITRIAIQIYWHSLGILQFYNTRMSLYTLISTQHVLNHKDCSVNLTYKLALRIYHILQSYYMKMHVWLQLSTVNESTSTTVCRNVLSYYDSTTPCRTWIWKESLQCFISIASDIFPTSHCKTKSKQMTTVYWVILPHVFHTPFYNCKWLCPVLNSPKHRIW